MAGFSISGNSKQREFTKSFYCHKQGLFVNVVNYFVGMVGIPVGFGAWF